MKKSSKLFLQEQKYMICSQSTTTNTSRFPKRTPVASSAPRKSIFKLIMENFITTQTQQNKEFMNQNVHTNELVKQLGTRLMPWLPTIRCLRPKYLKYPNNKCLLLLLLTHFQTILNPIRKAMLTPSHCEVGWN